MQGRREAEGREMGRQRGCVEGGENSNRMKCAEDMSQRRDPANPKSE